MTFIKEKDKNNYSDAELVSLYRQGGNQHILALLYQRYMSLIYGVCLNYLKDPEASKDAVLNIYEELITKVRQHEVTHFKSWLYTLSRNHCLMQMRKEKGKATIEIPATFMQSEEMLHLNGVLQKEEQFTQLEECMRQLIDEQKNCVELFYLHGKCYNEIVEQTGLDWNKVRSNIQNGRRNLKLCMEQKALNN